MKEAIEQVHEICWQRYTQAFNFFQSKSINLILSHRKVDHAIHFRDMEFLDDDVEYLKRYYHCGESVIRLHKLISYYQQNMTPPEPNLIPLEFYPVLESRRRKLLKHEILREKSLAQKQKDEKGKNELTEEEPILPEIDHSKFSHLSSEKGESSISSYDSSVHDLYADSEQEEEMREREEEEGEQVDILNTRGIRESYLIVDFKRRSEDKALQEGRQKVVREKQKKEGEKQKEKRKTESFMEYYNSISKKSSSNILQKYIKTKR